MQCCLYLNKIKNIKFVFIGGGVKNNIIRKFADDNKLNNCIFLPYQEYDQLSYTLTSADLALVTINSGMQSLIAPSKLYGHLAAGSCIALISQFKCYLKDLIKRKVW